MSISELAGQYTSTKAISLATKSYHESCFRSLGSELTSVDLADLRAHHLLDERQRQLENGVSETTVSKRIRTVVTWARSGASRETEVDTSVLELKIPRGKARKRDLDPQIASKVWESYRAKPHWALAMWLTQYHGGGARITDALLLPGKAEGQTRLKWTSSKTGFDHDVPLSQELLVLNHRHGDEHQFIAVPNWYPERAKKSSPWHRKQVGSATTRMNKELRRRDLGITSHDARRAAAYNLLSKGVDVDTVRRIGGWHKAEMVLWYAAHVKNDKVDGAMDLL